MHAGEPKDFPERILAVAVCCLPRGRAEWGRALRSELAGLDSRSDRWRFAVSGTRVALTAPRLVGAPGRSVVVSIRLAALACVAAVGFSLIRYPGIITGGTWVAIAVFLAILAGYVMAGGILVGQLDGPSRSALRIAVFGAGTIAALWLAIGAVASYSPSKPLSSALMLALPVVSFAVGIVAIRQGGSRRAGRCAFLLSALGAGLFGFVIWMGDTALTAGRPYDAGMRRDFATSGARDLATYAVNDNMGTAMVLLLLIPLLAGTFGFLGAATVRTARASND